MKSVLLTLMLIVCAWGQYDTLATHYNLEIYRINEGYNIEVDDTVKDGDTVNAVFTTAPYVPPYESPYTRYHFRTESFINTESMWEDTLGHISFTIDEYPTGIYELILNALAVSDTDTVIARGGDAMFLHVDTSDVSLSIDLTFFEVVLIDGHVSITWITHSEIGNCGFNIYKKELNGLETPFNKELIPGEGTSPNGATYGLIDRDVLPGHTYIYTLESISCSGISKVEGKVRVFVPFIYGIFLSQNYPNPTNGSTIIEYSIDDRSEVQLTLYDIRGGRIAHIFKGIQNPGSYSRTLNVDNIASGTYVYFLRVHNMRTMEVRILSKKLIVIK